MGEVWNELSPAGMFIGWPRSRRRSRRWRRGGEGGNHREGRDESGASVRNVWKCRRSEGGAAHYDTGKRDGRVRASVIILREFGTGRDLYPNLHTLTLGEKLHQVSVPC